MRKRDEDIPPHSHSQVVVRTVSNSISTLASAASIVLIAVAVAYLLHTYPASPVIASQPSEAIRAAADGTLASSSSLPQHNNTIGSFQSSEQNTITTNSTTATTNMNGNGNGSSHSLKKACFAGGCFWGLELALQRVAGVENTTVGYIGGKTTKPSYEQVRDTHLHEKGIRFMFPWTIGIQE